MVYDSGTEHSVSGSLGIVADWMGALCGDGHLPDVLNKLMKLVRADAVLLVRTAKADNKLRYIARHEAGAGRVWHSPAPSHAREIIGDSHFTAKAGASWRLTDSIMADHPAISDRGGANGVRIRPAEVIVISLGTESTHTDNLEIQFNGVPAQHDLNLITMLTGTLADCWRRRLPGTVAKQLARTRLSEVANAANSDEIAVLDIGNPARLSRCEFRVCSLLQEGMTVKVIARELSVCDATVRSHLSSIFAKTGTSCQVELLHRLNRENPSSSGDRIARVH